MTSIGGAIKFNNSSGSDTAASGYSSQNPTNAISISMMISSSSTTTSSAMWTGTISAGDLVYAPSSTSRKFNIVASVDNTVGFQSITFDNAFNSNISGTAYCGGKRSTLDNSDSRRLFTASQDHPLAGTSAGAWPVELEYTGTNYTLSSQLVRDCQRELTGVDPNNSGNKPTIVSSFNSAPVSDIESVSTGSGGFSSYEWENVIFDTSVYRSESQPYFEYANAGSHKIFFTGCEFDGGGGNSGASLLLKTNSTGAEQIHLTDCKFIVNQTGSATFTAAVYETVGNPVLVKSCRFLLDPNAVAKTNSYGTIESGTGSGVFVTASVMEGLGNGFYSGANTIGYTIGSVYYDCATAISRGLTSSCVANIMHDCTVGIASSSSGPVLANGFYNVGSSIGGITSNNGYQFSSDPLTNAANGDMTLSSSGQSEIVAIGSIFATPVTDGVPPIALNPLRMWDTGSGSSGGVVRITMNGGIDG